MTMPITYPFTFSPKPWDRHIIMLRPLDPGKLRALVCDEEIPDDSSIRSAKRFFAWENVLEGVHNLLQAFFRGEWSPHLCHDHSNRERWHIHFLVHKSVSVRHLTTNLDCRTLPSTPSTSEPTGKASKYSSIGAL